MDRRERINDSYEQQIMALQAWQAGMWTALPAVVVDYSPESQTITAQPTIQMKRFLPDGSWQWVTLPVLGDVPVVFPTGGPFTITFPVAPGDECLVVFSARCIDGWWSEGGVQQQLESRMHNLSDGFAIFGPRSKPRVLAPAPDVANFQIRSNDGSLHIELTPGGSVRIKAADVNVETSGKAVIDAAGGLEITGDVAVTGDTTFTGEVVANGKRIDDLHTHSGVTAGGATSGPVNSPP